MFMLQMRQLEQNDQGQAAGKQKRHDFYCLSLQQLTTIHTSPQSLDMSLKCILVFQMIVFARIYNLKLKVPERNLISIGLSLFPTLILGCYTYPCNCLNFKNHTFDPERNNVKVDEYIRNPQIQCTKKTIKKIGKIISQ